MKRTLALAMLTTLMAQGCTRQSDNPRFEIVSATFDEVNVVIPMSGDVTGASTPRHVIFKMDTQTGKTWRYYSHSVTSTNGVNAMEGWTEIK
jgi:hypothetical protein